MVTKAEKEAKAAAAAREKAFKAKAKELKSKEPDQILAACAAHGKDFDFLREGGGVDGLLRLLKHKDSRVVAAAVGVLANFLDGNSTLSNAGAPDGSDAVLQRQAADGLLVMKAGTEKGATWAGAEGLVALIECPTAAVAVDALRAFRGVLTALNTLDTHDAVRAHYLHTILTVGPAALTVMGTLVAKCMPPTDDAATAADGKAAEGAARPAAAPVLTYYALECIVWFIQNVCDPLPGTHTSVVVQNGIAENHGRVPTPKGSLIQDSYSHPMRGTVFHQLQAGNLVPLLISLCTAAVDPEGDELWTRNQSLALSAVQSMTWQAVGRSQLLAVDGLSCLVKTLVSALSAVPTSTPLTLEDAEANRVANAAFSKARLTLDAVFRVVASHGYAVSCSAPGAEPKNVHNQLIEVLVGYLRLPYTVLAERVVQSVVCFLNLLLSTFPDCRGVVGDTGVATVLIRLMSVPTCSVSIRQVADRLVHLLIHDASLADAAGLVPKPAVAELAVPAGAKEATEAAGLAFPASVGSTEPHLDIAFDRFTPAHVHQHVPANLFAGDSAWVRSVDLLRALYAGESDCPAAVPDARDGGDAAAAAAAAAAGAKAGAKGAKAAPGAKAAAPAAAGAKGAKAADKGGKGGKTAEVPVETEAVVARPLPVPAAPWPVFSEPVFSAQAPADADTKLRALRIAAAVGGVTACRDTLVEGGAVTACVRAITRAARALRSGQDASVAVQQAVLAAELLGVWARSSDAALKALAAAAAPLCHSLLVLATPASWLHAAGFDIDATVSRVPTVDIEVPSDAPGAERTEVNVAHVAFFALQALAEADSRFRVAGEEEPVDPKAKGKAAAKPAEKKPAPGAKGAKGAGKEAEEVPKVAIVGLNVDGPSTSIGQPFAWVLLRLLARVLPALSDQALVDAGCDVRTLLLRLISTVLAVRSGPEVAVRFAIRQPEGTAIGLSIEDGAPVDAPAEPEALPTSFWSHEALHEDRRSSAAASGAAAPGTEEDDPVAADKKRAKAVWPVVDKFVHSLLGLIKIGEPLAAGTESAAALAALRECVRAAHRGAPTQPVLADMFCSEIIHSGALVELIATLDAPPRPLTQQEEAAVRIQSIARGRAERLRANRLRKAGTFDNSFRASSFRRASAHEEVDRIRRASGVSRRRSDGDSASGAQSTLGQQSAANSTANLHHHSAAGHGHLHATGSESHGHSKIEEHVVDAVPLPVAGVAASPVLFPASGMLSVEEMAAFHGVLEWIVQYVIGRGGVRSGFWVGDATKDPNAGPTTGSWTEQLNRDPSNWSCSRYNRNHCSPLHVAVVAGKLHLVKQLLAAGATCNTWFSDKTSALMSALALGYHDIANVLLDAGADADALSGAGDPVLKYAFISPDSAKSGAFCSKYEVQWQCTWTPLPCIPAHLEGVVISAPFPEAKPVLRVSGSVAMVERVLACGADPNVSDAAGDFPLHWAVAGATIVGQLKSVQAELSSARVAVQGGKKAAAGRSASDQLVSMLFAAGASADGCNKYGRSPLHAAVAAGRLSNGMTMIACGCNPNVSDAFGNLALHFAAFGRGAATFDANNRAALVAALLDAGDGKPVVPGEYRDIRKGLTKAQRSQLEISTIIDEGLYGVLRPASLTQRVCGRRGLTDARNKANVSPLHVACGASLEGTVWWRAEGPEYPSLDAVAYVEQVESQAAIAEFICASGDADVNAASDGGMTPLHWVAQSWAGFRVLFEDEVEPSATVADDEEDFAQFLKMLHEGQPPPTETLNPQLAALAARVDVAMNRMVAALLRAGARINQLDSKYRAGGGGPRSTPLHLAILGSGRPTPVQAEESESPRAPEEAAAWAFLDAKALVLPATANPPAVTVACAVGRSRELVMELLIRASAEFRAQLAAAEARRLADLEASKGGWRRALEEEKMAQRVAAGLEAASGPIAPEVVNMRGSGLDEGHRHLGGTPLQAAAEGGHVTLVRMLSRIAGCDLEYSRPHNGHTALHLAAFRGHSSVVEALLANGASIEAVNKAGETPLVSAIRGNHALLVSGLVQFGRYLPGWLDHVNAAGETALDVALQLNQKHHRAAEECTDDAKQSLEEAAELSDFILKLLQQAHADTTAEESWEDGVE